MEQESASLDALLLARRTVGQKVAAAFEPHPDVTAVLVFGSVALGDVDERSDIDVLVICRDMPLSSEDKTAILATFDGRWTALEDDNPLFGKWDSGAVDGIAVDLHYQTASFIRGVLTEVVEEGAITTVDVPFRPYTVAGLIQGAWVVLDKDGLVREWQRYIANYPSVLKHNIIQHFATTLRESGAEMLSSAERRHGAGNFIFFLNRAVDAMISILFAVNEMYDPSERRTERVILPTLTRVPDGFIARLTDVIEGPFDDAGALQRAQSFHRLAQDVLKLTESQTT